MVGKIVVLSLDAGIHCNGQVTRVIKIVFLE